MPDDKKLLWILAIVAIVFVVGMAVEPSGSEPSIARYLIAQTGQMLVPFIAAYIGIKRARAFGFRSAVGKALLFLSLGAIAWGCGTFVWLLYNLFWQTEVPYPSLADIGFSLIIPLAAVGFFLLLKNLKIGFDKKTITIVSIIPVIVFAAVYWLFIQSTAAEGVSDLGKILNIYYPLGDAIFLSFSLVILSLVRGGKMFKPIGILCLGFVMQSIADFSFTTTTTLGTYYTGNWVDMTWTIAFLTMGIGMFYTNEMTKIEGGDEKAVKR